MKIEKSIKALQTTIGIKGEDGEIIDDVLVKIHQKILEMFSAQSIATCIPEVKEWVTPHWDRLEDESKQFLTTGAFLFKQFDSHPGADYAPAMLEYCRSLEKEVFAKLFEGYIENLVERKANLHDLFPESFLQNDTKVFAEFLNTCVSENPNAPEKWKFELGKMAYVLTRVLAKRQRNSLFADFRDYLNNAFDRKFFGEHFADQLSTISALRNACAHPSIVGQDEVRTGREIIRQKLNSILSYYG